MKRLLFIAAVLVLAIIVWLTATADQSAPAQADSKKQSCANGKSEQTPSSTGTGFFIIDSFSGIL